MMLEPLLVMSTKYSPASSGRYTYLRCAGWVQEIGQVRWHARTEVSHPPSTQRIPTWPAHSPSPPHSSRLPPLHHPPPYRPPAPPTHRTLSVSTNVCCLLPSVEISLENAASRPSMRMRLVSTNWRDSSAAGVGRAWQGGRGGGSERERAGWRGAGGKRGVGGGRKQEAARTPPILGADGHRQNDLHG
jgi:hypothetical protein